MILLGIDPGSAVTGYGVISSNKGEIRHVEHGVIRSGAKRPLPERLKSIYTGISEVMASHRPDGVAVEAVFHAKNARSALILGHARGVALLAAANHGVEIFEYSPLQIKQAVTGYGRAEKEQIRQMIKAVLAIRGDIPLDASDALAAAVCHAHSMKFNAYSGTTS